MSTMEFDVFCLNVWGLLRISQDRKPRMNAIADQMVKGHYDFVLLQELWVRADFDLIFSKVKSVYPFAHHFQGGAIGSGLAVFSQSPIENVLLIPYAANGKWYKPWHGDWFAGKGVALAQVVHKGFRINLMTTHAHVDVGPEAQYKAVRYAQGIVLADFVNSVAYGADATILCGDLNSDPTGYLYNVVKALGQLHDSFDVAAEKYCNPALYFEGKDIGGTCNLPSNKYCPESYKNIAIRDTAGSRLDYVLFRSGIASLLKCVRHSRPLPNRIPNYDASFSDHEAVHVNFFVSPSRGRIASIGEPQRMHYPVIEANEGHDENEGPPLEGGARLRSLSSTDYNDSASRLQTIDLLKDAIDWLDRQMIKSMGRMLYQFIAGCVLLVILLGTLIIPVSMPWWAWSLIGVGRIFLTAFTIVLGFLQPVYLFREKRALLESRQSAALKLVWLEKQLQAAGPLSRGSAASTVSTSVTEKGLNNGSAAVSPMSALQQKYESFA